MDGLLTQLQQVSLVAVEEKQMMSAPLPGPASMRHQLITLSVMGPVDDGVWPKSNWAMEQTCIGTGYFKLTCHHEPPHGCPVWQG